MDGLYYKNSVASRLTSQLAKCSSRLNIRVQRKLQILLWPQVRGSGSATRQILVLGLQADRALEDCLQRPVIFICHGLGSIFVKKALAYSSTRTSQHIEHLYSIFASTYAILFFGTPYQGTNKAQWLAVAHAESPRHLALPRFDTQLLLATEKGSETL